MGRNPTKFLPLAPLDFQVLTILGTRDLHGYGIVQAAQEAFPEQPLLDIGSVSYTHLTLPTNREV